MILPDWAWRLVGERVVAGFDPGRINPHSYDLTLDHLVRLQVYRGVEFPNTTVGLQPDGTLQLHSCSKHEHALWQRAVGDPHGNSNIPFQPGDRVLGSTRELLMVPRWMRLQGMLKSSVGREGLDHATALYIDAGFAGYVTLELDFKRSGFLAAFQPVIQVEAQLLLLPPLRSYRQTGRYGGQVGPTPNRNPLIAFRSAYPQ